MNGREIKQKAEDGGGGRERKRGGGTEKNGKHSVPEKPGRRVGRAEEGGDGDGEEGGKGGGGLAVSVSVLRVTYDDMMATAAAEHGVAWQSRRETYVPSFCHCHWNLIRLSPNAQQWFRYTKRPVSHGRLHLLTFRVWLQQHGGATTQHCTPPRFCT